MSARSIKRGHRSGQVLLGILVSLSVFLILAHSLFTLISSSYSLVSYNKARITARFIAMQQMELIRNLSYSDIGTVGGIPAGIIEPEENIYQNGLNFQVKSSIIYADDSFNGEGPPNDTDYKRVQVEVSWDGVSPSRDNPVKLNTDVAANASTTADGGTLVVLVFDANGDPVPLADVTITADSIVPSVNLTLKTDSEGKITLPGATECVGCYHIVVTKDGYSTDRTYSVSEVANPIKPDTSIFVNSVTQMSFAIDTLGTLSISSFGSRSDGYPSFGNVTFNIHGNKIIGTDAYAQPVYKYDETFVTDGSGVKNLTDMEFDVYQIEMPEITSYDIAGNNPLQPINVDPGTSVNLSFSLIPHTDHSFLLSVKDASQNLIASASARLFDGVGYESILFTGESENPDFGQAFFDNLSEKNYQIEASASGYTIYTGNFDISGSATGQVVLTPQ